MYLDTSVLAPFYWTEALSGAVVELLSREGIEPVVSQLVEVELVSALSRRVRMGEVSQEGARVILQRFQANLDAGFYLRFAVEPVHYQMARNWIGQFNTALRTLEMPCWLARSTRRASSSGFRFSAIGMAVSSALSQRYLSGLWILGSAILWKA